MLTITISGPTRAARSPGYDFLSCARAIRSKGQESRNRRPGRSCENQPRHNPARQANGAELEASTGLQVVSIEDVGSSAPSIKKWPLNFPISLLWCNVRRIVRSESRDRNCRSREKK